MTESNRIEYKQELNDKLEKEVIAFLNYKDGGIIYIGINNNGKVIGLKNCDALQLKIKDRLKNNIQPSCLGLFDVIHEIRDEKDIVRITVASGSEKPYYLKKKGMTETGCFIRVGSASEQMPLRMIEELFSKRTRNSLGKIKSNKQDLSFEQLKIYYNETNYSLTNKFATNLELLTETGDYNYVAYLMSDKNSNSIKVAKYSGTSRVDLIESNEYGYCSIVKATKQVLDKLELENKTTTKITSKERHDKRLWNAIAIREAVINAIVHNDYSKEIPPKFEIFSDRLEITSAGSLPEGLGQDEFFEGYSVPRNKEIMRIYKDIEMVEHLGSGVPRILESYKKDCFIFTNNFLRMVFPATELVTDQDTDQVTDQDTDQVKQLVKSMGKEPLSAVQLLNILSLAHRPTLRKNYLKPALSAGYVTMTIPDKPKSKMQRYKLTVLGKKTRDEFSKIKTDSSQTSSTVIQQTTDQDTDQVTDQVKQLINSIGEKPLSTLELLKILSLNHRPTLRENYIKPALQIGYVTMTIPDKPNSRMQKYKLTELGKKFKLIINKKLRDNK